MHHTAANELTADISAIWSHSNERDDDDFTNLQFTLEDFILDTVSNKGLITEAPTSSQKFSHTTIVGGKSVLKASAVGLLSLNKDR